MVQKTAAKAEKLVIWFSRILRLALGLTLLFLSYRYAEDDYSWVLLVFGIGITTTAFLRPKRCLDDNCSV